MSESQQGAEAHQIPHDNHGNTVEAWTSVTIMAAGFLVMSLAVVFTTVWMFIVGAVVVAAGAAAWKVLGSMRSGMSGPDKH